jgi:FlaA1/EpsC-like NDP-sugar epimerase
MRMSVAIILGYGIATRNLSVIINAVVALAVTYLPALLERDWDVRLSPELTFVVTLAVSLHTLGMVGLYEEVWWYDHLTHTLSAMLVAAVGYAATRAIDLHSEEVSFPPRFLSLFLLLFTLALGVFWEVLEFAARQATATLGIEAVLVQYGLEDTILDLVFDTVGAIIVALFGTERLTDLAETLRERLAV